MIGFIVATAIVFYIAFGYWMFKNGILKNRLGKWVYVLLVFQSIIHVLHILINK